MPTIESELADVNAVFGFLAEQPILTLFLFFAVGILIGHIRVKGISLGAAAVLFVAIGVTAWGLAYGHEIEIPELVGNLGLAMFTYTVGIVSGPGFFAALKSGLGPILATIGIIVGGAVIAIGVGSAFGMDFATITGSFAGAVTNTPAMAAAGSASGDPGAAAAGYSVTYLYGVLGMLAATILALRQRAKDTDTPDPITNLTVRVDRDDNPSIRDLESANAERVTFSRIRHGEENPIEVAAEDDTLRKDDLVTVVGPRDQVSQIAHFLGHASSHTLETDRRYLDFRRITLSNGKLAGRTIGELNLTSRFGATVSRVRRADVDMVATDSLVLQPGDRLRVIAPAGQMKKISAYLGDSARGLADINPLALGVGMALGIGLGAIHIPIGQGFTLGSAAGTLIVGLVFGRLGRIGPMITTMPHLAATALNEFGLLAFLAYAGTRAGLQISSAFESGAVPQILLLGVAVTTFVAFGTYFVMRTFFHIGGTKLSGMLGGTQTQPAILAYANQRTAFDNRVALGYALVYPTAMIVKILVAQIMGGF